MDERDPRHGSGPLRLAELVAALSVAIDFGTGRTVEHTMRTCLLSLELARRSGVGIDRLSEVYYVALLRFVGCTADASETAMLAGGDDIRFMQAIGPAWMGTPNEQLRALIAGTGSDLPLRQRMGRLAATLTDVGGARRSVSEHCEAAQILSSRLAVGEGVTDALGLAFERWDGRGIPGRTAGTEVPPPVRVVVVARDVDLWIRLGGLDTALDVLRKRRGHSHDPDVVDAFIRAPTEVLAAVATPDAWQATLDAEPPPRIRIGEQRLEQALRAFADFADLKSPSLRGHSSGVADLAADAGVVAGLDVDDVRALRLAGLVHDIGRVGVANGIWDHTGPLSAAAWEKVRLHPYLSERILTRSRRLAPLARLAACHHERRDGSGYHRGARGHELSAPERLLGAADCYHAMIEPRPHRPARTSDEACAELRRGARDGRFEAREAEAVLEAAGHAPTQRRRSRPAGLTDREIDVLRLIARGRSNRQVAQDLSISPRTVGTHVEHIYAKAGVTTRAGAALFAMEHRLL